MPFIEYRDISFRPATLDIIERARAICKDYTRQGYNLTLRQLYYQFVARGWMPNKRVADLLDQHGDVLDS